MFAPHWIALLAITVATLLACVLPAGTLLNATTKILDSRRTPWVIGLATALSFWWIAGATLRVEAISTDEASYLLQAQLFARGEVTAPAPPIPEFFEQAWVVVTPRIYSKYPPGHALVLAPGVALGLPWLVPFLLNLVSGTLLFALLRRGVGAAAALVCWMAWLFSGMAMAWQTTYFSEITSLACWLGIAACTWRWVDEKGPRWLVGAALLAGFGFLTRPLSILLLSLPLAAVVILVARRERRWREVARAALAGAALLLVVPAWNLATTGHAGRSPLREYTETYLPWDRLGFAIDSTPALRPAPPDLQAIAGHLAKVHREHTVARLPRTLLERADRVRAILFTHWRVLLLGALLFGGWRLGRAGWLAMAAGGSLFLGHAVWGHEAGWTLYYAESAPFWFLPGAVGLVTALTWVAARARPPAEAGARAGAAILFALPVLLLLSIEDSATYRHWRGVRASESRALTDFISAGPDHSIYFIRYGPASSGRPGEIRNDPDLAGAHAWVVYDLGERDQELLRAAPDRRGFLVDEATRAVTPLPRAPTP